MDFESKLIEQMRASSNVNVKKFLKWLDANPKGPLRKRRLNKLKADAQHILKEDADGLKVFRGRELEALGDIDLVNLLQRLIPFIRELLKLFM